MFSLYIKLTISYLTTDSSDDIPELNRYVESLFRYFQIDQFFLCV